MDNNNDIQYIIADSLKEATKGAGNINIIVAGKTGVGKSTLINSIFRGEFARTGSGRPITKRIEEIKKPGHPLTIIDTKGLEVSDYEKIKDDLYNYIKERLLSDDQNEHIHIAWLCIAANGDRIENAEIDLCNMLNKNNIPVISVLTKSKKNDNFVKEAEKLLPNSKYIIPVRAIHEQLEEVDATLPPFGIDDLITSTSKLIPEAQKRAYANALSNKNKGALDVKKIQAEKEVNIASGLAITAGATPIPFSDAIVLVPIQVGMIAKIGVTFGMELSTATLATIIGSVLGSSAATIVGRTVVSGLLKLIPLAGPVIGGSIAGTTAGFLTKTLGNSYISVLYDFCFENPGKEIDIDIISTSLKKKFNNLIGDKF
jgi:uncharacterized protein (DUF697 family)/predicted GTPase